MNTSFDQILSVLIEPDAHRYARIFAAEQASPAKGKRVYLNTLSVYAVRTYLDWLSIPTDLSGSDCWHPGLRALFDVADLVLPGVGKLECRPVLPKATEMVIMPTAEGDRVGYVAVRLSENLKRAELLGFVSAAVVNGETDAVSLEQLQPLENLILAMYPSSEVVNLRSWLEQIFTPEWLPPMRVVSVAFRGLDMPTTRHDPLSSSRELDLTEVPLSRVKLLNFNKSDPEESNQTIALMLKLMNTPEGETNIQVQFLPTGESTLLPQGLQVLLLDATGTVCAEALSQEDNDRIQITFGVATDEEFSLQTTLAGDSIIQRFKF